VGSIIIVITASVVAIKFLMGLILPWLMAISFCYYYFGPSKNVAVWVLLHVILDQNDGDYCGVFALIMNFLKVIQILPFFSLHLQWPHAAIELLRLIN